LKLSKLVVGAVAMLVIAWSVGRVQGKLEQVNAQEKVIFASPDKEDYKSMAPGVSTAPIWGDDTK
jgi:hypothetical protein